MLPLARGEVIERDEAVFVRKRGLIAEPSRIAYMPVIWRGDDGLADVVGVEVMAEANGVARCWAGARADDVGA